MDLVDVLVLSAFHAAADRAFFFLHERSGAARAGGIDARVLGVVADIEVPVTVEVVASEVASVGSLGVGQLALVQVDVVEPVLDPVVRVVDPALYVCDPNVFAAKVPLRPGAGHVYAGGVIGIVGIDRPARKAAIGMRLVGHGAARRTAGVARERPKQVPLLVVGAAADRILGLARREPG